MENLILVLGHIMHNKLSQFTLASLLILSTSIPLEAISNQKESGNLTMTFPNVFEFGSTGKGGIEFYRGRTRAAQGYWSDTQGRSNTSLWTPCRYKLKISSRHTRWLTYHSISERDFRGSKRGTDVAEQQRTDTSKFDFGIFKYSLQDKQFNVSGSAIIAHFVSSWGLSLIVGLQSSSVLLLFVVFGIYSSVKINRSINIKSKLFKKNGGPLLEQLLATHGPRAGGPKVFTAEELEMATEYNQGPRANSNTNGTAYSKLPLANSEMEMVFVKEKVLVEEGQIERFINEIITLAQMNHENVIKLLGCCLETEDPILVYEFASNGSLFSYIHDPKNGENSMPHWDILMEIAAESAAGLAYLHSLSIIHGNIKSSNILMTDCKAKVAGFRPPRLIASNESQTSTLVQMTLGYLDPEYLLTGQLTDKSDVYSFGVILVEILTGEKPINFDRPESQRIITSHFLLSMELQNGLLQILAPQVKGQNKEQATAVAELAKRCLKLRSAERPSMDEVARELKTLSDIYITVHGS
ncbi:putative wall-associated receptor kinase-like 16 [Argentina anserina]|uniref:putative wall-associated receptor kinase-like 16 n=1 Tax=Argentina anserina TaxID=57926 RepID=UPI0021766D10|nr:putative wall-associated receptor kinase-like 16 [Potentilla anserina]